MCVLRHLLRRKHHHNHHCLLLPTFLLLLFSSSSAITTLAPQPSTGTVKYEETKNLSPEVTQQEKLNGPGSAPPSCRSKCGWCNPCHPVHVPVQPGLIIRLEYYPEAWRCKCGNKLFLP
ncbi:EPIDERMAL PATTERNING FACTOR-like protein 5 [Vicia villosa]|uniref:EPIDERMAL PATTERNING FACTOR-like protein 5 n=1 Tax=Vicia villosa TaxID=3911 RepID=UPI00273C5535|nr:EPIDERMAL PATTERNING FACTOR-like protein 5 [Vicia villosa]